MEKKRKGKPITRASSLIRDQIGVYRGIDKGIGIRLDIKKNSVEIHKQTF
jgi:hypothetical protein